MYVLYRELCYFNPKMHLNAFGGRGLYSDPLIELTALPGTPAGLRGGKRKEERVREVEG